MLNLFERLQRAKSVPSGQSIQMRKSTVEAGLLTAEQESMYVGPVCIIIVDYNADFPRTFPECGTDAVASRGNRLATRQLEPDSSAAL
jgi:hypothetical protein